MCTAFSILLLAAFKLSVNASATSAKSAAKKLSPTGKLPVLSTRRGVVFGTNAIAKHIGRCNPGAGLYGFSPEEGAQVDQWSVQSCFVNDAVTFLAQLRISKHTRAGFFLHSCAPAPKDGSVYRETRGPFHGLA